jgi:hypothetical protein
MKSLKFLLIIPIIGLLIIGCSGKVARIKEQLDLGSKYMAELDYENAIIALNKAIEIDPKNVDAYAMLAKVYGKSGRPDEAKSTLEKALEIENLSSQKIDEINEEIEVLQYLVKISQIPKEYDESLSIELSNAKSLRIFYNIETENSEMSTVDEEYTNPIILDKNGTYIITTYTMDENDVKHDEAKVKYTIKLKSSNDDSGTSEAKSKENTPEISKGWKQLGEDWYYYGDTGEPVNGEQVIDDKSYYFDNEGKLIRNQFIREEIDASEKEDIYYKLINSGEDIYILGDYADSDGVLWDVAELSSNGEVIDRGDYYEVTGAKITGWNYDKEYNKTDMYAQKDIGSIKIRKDAKLITFEDENENGDTYLNYYLADTYYSVAGGKLSAGTKSETLDLDNNWNTVVDKEGYIIGAKPAYDADDSGTGMLTYEQ